MARDAAVTVLDLLRRRAATAIAGDLLAVTAGPISSVRRSSTPAHRSRAPDQAATRPVRGAAGPGQ
jgi:hypothetical protein